MNSSNASLLALIAVVGILLVASLAVWIYARNRTRKLRAQFGSEYEREMEAAGRRPAEARLMERAARVKNLRIQPLLAEDRQKFISAWRTLQSRFVDKPETAIVDADWLVLEVMLKRGYPAANFDQRAADISVDHAAVVENYREAHAIALMQSRGEASTEDMRQALIHYRTIFNDLVFEEEAQAKAA